MNANEVPTEPTDREIEIQRDGETASERLMWDRIDLD